VRAGQDAVAATPAGQPDRSMYLDNLGAALQALAEHTGRTALLEQAERCFAQAAADTDAPAAVRISGYQSMFRLPDHAGLPPRQALEVMETAAELLLKAAPRNLTRADRQYSLGRLASIAGLAAAAAVTAGQPGRGVELLEQTRGILAADTLDARSSDLARLRTRAPEQAQAFENLRARIDTLTSAAPLVPSAEPAGHGPDPAQARREAAAAWDDLLAHIRAVDGFQDFLRPPDLAQLAAQARPGPVIFPYATPSRCDAVILTSEPGTPVRVVPLPGLTENDAISQANRLLRARQIALGEDTSLRARRAAHNEILDILAWMWDVITGPILDSLGHAGTPGADQPWPRVWWCPVGILGYLPLHASGHHDDTVAHPQPRAVLDRVVSSYTTTVRGLSDARTQHPDPAADSVLIVAVAAAPGAGTLAGVAAEADDLARLIPRSQLLPDPTRKTVLEGLPAHPLVHFACHGYANWTDPGASMLILPGDRAAPLTVADISALQLTGSLAYLSACDTTVTSPNLADEAIHITGAFHLAGYAHVIGTLWPVNDATARDLTRDVYGQLTRDGSAPPDVSHAAHALHHATRRLRDHPGDEPPGPGQPDPKGQDWLILTSPAGGAALAWLLALQVAVSEGACP